MDLSPFSAYQPSPEFEELLRALCDDGLGAEQARRLEEIVIADDDACWHYLCQVHLHGTLQWNIAPPTPRLVLPWEDSREGRGLGTSVPSGASGEGIQDSGFGTGNLEFAGSPAPNPESPVPSPEPFIPPITIDTSAPVHLSLFSLQSPLGGMLFSYGVAVVLTGMAILGAWAYKVSLGSGTGILPGHVASTGQPPAPPANLAPELVGQITGMFDCQWADPDIAPAGPAVPLGRKYALSSGLMEIAYQTEAKVILQGPCIYEVESDHSGFLSLGKLTARVEKSKIRNPKSEAPNSQSLIPNPLFAVRTPTAVVTDLGTEFGVEVTREGRTDAQVFQGTIRVATAAGEGDAGSGHVCREGEAVRVEAGKSVVRTISPGEKHAGSFVRVMPSKKAIDSQAYAELVLSLKPVVYYRMEQPSSEKDRFVVFDSAPGGHQGELRLGNEFGGAPYRPGRFGDAIWLRGPEAEDRVIVRDYPKTTNDRLTVSAWVMAMGRPGWAMIASNWGFNNAGQFHFGLYQRYGDLSVHVMQRDGQGVSVREGASQPFPMFAWQHVVFVADGTTLHLYRNGKEVASTPAASILAQPPVASLGVGCRTNEEGTDALLDVPYHNYWQGRIDELAIFNRAFSAQQIEQLYLGKPLQDRQADSAAGTRRVPSAIAGTQLVPEQLPLESNTRQPDGTRSVPTTKKGGEPMNGP